MSQWMPEEVFRLEKLFFLFAFFMFGVAYAANRGRLDRWLYRPITLAVAVVVAVVASGLNIAGLKVLYEPIYASGVAGAILVATWLLPKVAEGSVRRALAFVGQNSIV